MGAFLPKIAETGSGRALQCRAAVAATFVAGLELTRGGALTLDQGAPWQPVRIYRRSDDTPDSATAPAIDEYAPSLA